MSSRATRLRSEKYAGNVLKRGKVPKGRVENKVESYSVGTKTLAFFMFVVVGSSIFQLFKMFGVTNTVSTGEGGPKGGPKEGPRGSPKTGRAKTNAGPKASGAKASGAKAESAKAEGAA